MKLLRRGCVVLLEMMVLLCVICVVMAGALLWRLTSAPVELGFMTPYLERALESDWSGTRAQIGTTLLTWDDRSEFVELSAQDVQILDLSGEVAFALPEIEVKLSLRALLRGLVAPTEIEVKGARLVVQSLEGGGFIFGQKDQEHDYRVPQREDEAQGLEVWLDRILANPDPARPLSYVTALQLYDSEVTYINQAAGQLLVVPVRLFELTRVGDNLVGEVDLAVGSAADAPLVEADFIADHGARRIDLAADFSRLRPAAFADWQPETEALAILDLPFEGRVSASLGFAGDLETVALTLAGGEGHIAPPDLSTEPLGIAALALEAELEVAANRLRLSQASVTLRDDDETGSTVTLKGELQASEGFLAGERKISAQLGLDGVAVNRVPRYWPVEVLPDARPWILGNIKGGRIEDLEALLALTLPADDPAAVRLDDVSGEFRTTDVAVHYLRPLPPVEHISATALFDADTVSFTFDRADLGRLVVEDGTLILSGLENPDYAAGIHEEIYLDLGVRAPVLDALTLLEHPRLDLLSGLGISAQGTAGDAGARLVFRFPLLKDLTFDDMEIGANAALKGCDQARSGLSPRLPRQFHLRRRIGRDRAGRDQHSVDARRDATARRVDRPGQSLDLRRLASYRMRQSRHLIHPPL